MVSFHEKDEVEEESHLLQDLDDTAHVDPGTLEANLDGISDAQSTRHAGHNHQRTSSNVIVPRRTAIYQQFRDFFFFLVPSFVQHKIRTPQPSRPVKLHPSAYLDGIRGIAALFVFFYHLSYSCHDVYTAWGTGEPGQNREFFKLPFVRFIHNGHAQVAIFYVVSGYALSCKPVKLMAAKKWEELTHTTSSAIFRRAIRLYLPCLASTLFVVFLVRVGAYEATMGIATDPNRLPFSREWHTPRELSTFRQLVVWARKMFDFIQPWTFGTKDTMNDLDSHTWSITMEFRASLVLYLTHLGLARLKPILRISSLVLLILWVHQKDRWEMILFYAGFLLAELDFHKRSLSPTGAIPYPSRSWSILYIVVFLIGIYLGGQPEINLDHAPGWQYLIELIPGFVSIKPRYWPNWGAILLVWSTSCHPLLQKLFTNRPVQYLGKISFALYLMHGPMTHTVGYGMMDLMWSSVGMDTYFHKELGFFVAGVVDVGVTIWAADVFTRAVDTPSVNFAKWFEGKCIVKLD